jgi:hypothetical protein
MVITPDSDYQPAADLPSAAFFCPEPANGLT